MLRSGKSYLDSIRDDRRVYVGNQLVRDVTEHPAFARAAHMYAEMYDRKADPKKRDVMSYEEDGERHSMYFLQPTSEDDLVRRTQAHQEIAAFSHGLLGRSPDHVASSITGMAMRPEVFDQGGQGFSTNIVNYYKKARDEDLYVAYAILPPQGARNPELYEGTDRKPPTLRVTAEDDEGVTLNGMKMLATGAVFADECIIGNIIPLAPSQVKESITCAVPVNLPGLSLWSRKPFAPDARNEFDNPLSWKFDETDSMVVFDDVKVPWERVFVHDDPDLSRNIYVQTPAHFMSNHQSNVRFWSKLRLLVGLASRITKSNGAHQIPAVREILGRLAAMEAAYGAMIAGQQQTMEAMDNGFVHVNRRGVYAAVNYALENHAKICDEIKTLCGGGVFQMPASADVVKDDHLRQVFEAYWGTADQPAADRMKLFRLAWDLLGSEFAGRHEQYEKFYVGPAFIVRNYNFVNAPWDDLEAIVDQAMDGYDLPD